MRLVRPAPDGPMSLRPTADSQHKGQAAVEVRTRHRDDEAQAASCTCGGGPCPNALSTARALRGMARPACRRESNGRHQWGKRLPQTVRARPLRRDQHLDST